MDNDIVFQKFRDALAANGVIIDKVDDSGLLYISIGEMTLKVSLDNVRRNFARDQDESHISDLVETILSYSEQLPESWELAREHIYVSFFPNDQDFDHFIHSPVTDVFDKIYAYHDGKKESWISDDDLANWGITQTDLINQAEENANALSITAELDIKDIGGHRLGFISHERVNLKGALLFSSALISRIGAQFGFPFYAVLPVRDFCYIFSEEDLDFFSASLGPTVVEEYTNSGYPITTEVLRFGQDEVVAIGQYPIDQQ